MSIIKISRTELSDRISDLIEELDQILGMVDDDDVDFDIVKDELQAQSGTIGTLIKEI